MSFLQEPGDLAQTPLAAVLLEALNLRADGVLAVEHGGGTSRLWFRAGQPVGAQVFTGFRPLGHMLLQAGKIDVDALSRSLAEMASSGRPQGEILVELGAVSRADVDEALADQQSGYFALIAALDAGRFAFDAAQPVPEWTRGSRLSPLRTIVDALERPQAGALVVSALQPVAQGGARLASGYAEVAEHFRWGEGERALVERLSRPAALEVFFAPQPGVAPERARAILAALLLLGLAVPAAERAAPSGETVAGLTLEGVAAAVVARGEAPPPTSPAVPLRRSDPAEARARRQRLLSKAMQNMGVGPFGARPAAAPAPGAAAEAAPGPAFTPPPGQTHAVAGSAEAALRQALLEVAPRARERSLFTRLGLPEGAGKDEVKRAFLQIARQFHPDRFASPSLGDLRGAVSDFFTAVNEAYEVLSDDRKRAEYLSAARGGASNPQRAESARVDYQKGEACIRTRDFARARGFLESAIRADGRAEYQAALAWTYVVDPAGKDLAKARALAVEAAKEATCDRAQYVAGIVARDEGNEAEAERYFRAAVAANPRHVDALRELKQVEGRRAQRRG
ncbi:MAG: DnaJ domain-containing protein [Anaeromyxobacteraceae bacterium]|nr:DnaJ domain-containing protein [Anaeromyxobacteraceae bacterium]